MTERRSSRRLLFAAALTLVAAVLLRTWVFGVVQVQTSSMQPTIRPGEVLLFDRLGDPSPGDIVILEFADDPGVLHVKRLIAVGPAEVELVGGRLYVDGKPASPGQPELGEWYADDCQAREAIFVREHTGDAGWTAMMEGDHVRTELREGDLWLLGDNRGASEDSRQWGVIPESLVQGKVLFRLRSPGQCEGLLGQEVPS